MVLKLDIKTSNIMCIKNELTIIIIILDRSKEYKHLIIQ